MVNLILIGVIALYLLICVAFGFLRGLAKSRIRLITVAASAVIAFITALIMKKNLVDAQAVSESIRSLQDIGITFSADMLKVIDDLLGSKMLTEAILGFSTALIMPIIFVVLFSVLCFITWIIHVVVTLVLHDKLKAQNERSSFKLLRTAGLNLLQGIIVVVIVLVPINVYGQLVPPVMDSVEATEMLKDNPEVYTIMEDYVEPFSKSIAGVSKPLGKALTSFKIGDQTVYLQDEVQSMSSVVCTAMSLGDTKMTNFGETQATMIKGVGDTVSDSALLSTIVGEIVYYYTDAWIADEKFIGMKRPEMGDMFDPAFMTLLEVVHKDAKAPSALKADIYTTADMIAILANYDVFTKLDDTDSLIVQLGADGMVKELVVKLGENDSMKVLIPEVTNIGMRAIAMALDIPGDGAEVYAEFLDDIAEALNSTADMNEEERLAALTEKVTQAFDTANVPIEKSVLDSYSASLLKDLGSVDEVTADDISDFFTVYAMSSTEEDDPSDPTQPVSAKVNKPLRGRIYGAMSEDELARCGAATLKRVSEKLANIEATTEEEIALAAKQIIVEEYTNLFGASDPIVNKLSDIDLKKPLDKAIIDNTAGMQSADTMNSGVITVEKLLVNVQDAAANITPDKVDHEAEKISTVFGKVSEMMDGGLELNSVEDITKSLGPVFDAMNDSNSVGEEKTANLLIAVMQSEEFRKNADLDMETATNLGKKATESKNGEKVNYEQTMNSLAGAVNIGNSFSTGEFTSEEQVRDFIDNLNPQSAGVMSDYITPDRMMGYGFEEKKATMGANLLSSLFDNLAKDMDPEESARETAAVQQLLNIAIVAKDNNEAGTKIFGENGRLRKDADEMIKIIVKSDAVCDSLAQNLLTQDGIEMDPFGISGQIPDDSADKAEFIAAANYYHQMNGSEEVDLRLQLIAALFGIDLNF